MSTIASAAVAASSTPGSVTISEPNTRAPEKHNIDHQQKQIRFVNNEGQPPVKRRRIGAACRTCRKRKTRCDGRRPNCETCTDNGHECLGYKDDDGEENSRARGGVALHDNRGDDGFREGSVHDMSIMSQIKAKGEHMSQQRLHPAASEREGGPRATGYNGEAVFADDAKEQSPVGRGLELLLVF